MPDFGRTGDNYSGDNEPSLDDIRRSDSFVDALAGGSPVASDDPADAALAALLGGWRDEMRWPPATGLISEPQAIAALDAGLAEKPGGLRRDKRTEKQVATVTPMRNRRGLSMVGAAAAAVLCIGGFGAVVAGAGPGDALYGLRSMLFGAPKEVRDDAVALAARSELNRVQELIAQGDWQQAQEKLVAVSTQVASIGDEQQKQDLFDEFNDLSAKVVERDPAATAPPGIIYTVPETAAELVPAVAPPTSVPTAPSPSDSTSAATSTPASTSAEQTATSASPNSTTATSGAPTSSQSPASAATSTQTATPTTTPASAAPVTTSAPAASSSAASSSPSAAQATSSAAATTTSATPRVASSSPASSPVSTTAAVPTTTTTAPVASPAQASTTQAPTTVQTTATPAEDSSAEDSNPADSSPSESVPTTTAVPIPVTTTTVPVAAG
ncbi:MAG: anti-sigma-D factor RsdA [Mycobacterium sp.]|nr:anti-sigma-D factor RsdA [Mycobacterium sp.]